MNRFSLFIFIVNSISNIGAQDNTKQIETLSYLNQLFAQHLSSAQVPSDFYAIRDSAQVPSDFYAIRDFVCDFMKSDAFQSKIRHVYFGDPKIFNFEFMQILFQNNHISFSNTIKKHLFEKIKHTIVFDSPEKIVYHVRELQPSHLIGVFENSSAIIAYQSDKNYTIIQSFNNSICKKLDKFFSALNDDTKQLQPLAASQIQPLAASPILIRMPSNCGDPTIFKLHLCLFLAQIIEENNLSQDTLEEITTHSLFTHYYQKKDENLMLQEGSIIRKYNQTCFTKCIENAQHLGSSCIEFNPYPPAPRE